MEEKDGWIGHNTGDCISCREVIDGLITADERGSIIDTAVGEG